MTLLPDALESKKLDTRVVERNLVRGIIAQSDLDKSLKTLPDDSANAEYTNLEELKLRADVK